MFLSNLHILFYTITNSNPLLGSLYCKKRDTFIFLIFHACIISFKMSNFHYTRTKNLIKFSTRQLHNLTALHLLSINPTNLINGKCCQLQKTEYLRVCVLFDSHCLLECSVFFSCVNSLYGYSRKMWSMAPPLDHPCQSKGIALDGEVMVEH